MFKINQKTFIFSVNLYIDAKTSFKKDKIARKLKENNFFPLPIEFEKKISLKASNILCGCDPDEFAYKKNLKLVPDKILKKYCNLFSIDEKKKKNLDYYYKILYQFNTEKLRVNLPCGRLCILQKK